MSLPLLICALADTVIILVLAYQIRVRYQSALTSVEEKSAGKLFFYRNSIQTLFRGQSTPEGVYCLLQYAALHLLVPLFGFGLYLRTDGNFLVVIASLFWSMQLFQRLFPGTAPESDEDFDEESDEESEKSD